MPLWVADERRREGHSGVRERRGDLGQEHRGQKRKFPEHLTTADQEQVGQSLLASASAAVSDGLATEGGAGAVQSDLLDDL